MTIDEAKQAIQKNLIIELVDDENKWGYLTCLSDDETTAYYKPRGQSFSRIAVTLDKIKIGWPYKNL